MLPRDGAVPPRHAVTLAHRTSSCVAPGTPSPHNRTRRTSRLNYLRQNTRLPSFALLLRAITGGVDTPPHVHVAPPLDPIGGAPGGGGVPAPPPGLPPPPDHRRRGWGRPP